MAIERISEQCHTCGWLELFWVQVSTQSTAWYKYCQWCQSIFGPFMKGGEHGEKL